MITADCTEESRREIIGRASCVDVLEESSDVLDDPAPQEVSLSETFKGSLDDVPSVALEEADVERLRRLQSQDPSIKDLRLMAVEKLEDGKGTCFYETN